MSDFYPARVPGNGYSLESNSHVRSDSSSTAAVNRASWAGSQGSTGSSNGENPTIHRFPHIKDLNARAKAAINVSVNSSISTLIARAQQSAKQASTDVSFRRPDRAYVEWLISSEIIVNVIPRHRDYPTLNRERVELHQVYRSLYKQHEALQQKFEDIYATICKDNARSGIKPSYRDLHRSSSPQYHDRDHYSPQADRRPISMPEPPKQETLEQIKSNPINGYERTSNGNPSSGQVDPLAERFAQLRIPQNSPVSSKPLPNRTSSQNGGPVGMPSPTRYSDMSSRNSFPALSQVQTEPNPPFSKPYGPRAMPTAQPPSRIPPHPPKIPLDTKIASSFPRAPETAYSPARNSHDPASIAPPRSTPRSMVGSSGTPSQVISSASSYAPGTTSNSYFPNSNGGYRDEFSRKDSFAEPPNATAVSAKELFDRMRDYNVLIIDVRSREEFDQGHIITKSVMCVEPVSLRSGAAAEDLEERLVVSPETEQILFARRNEFDLVVYYDQDTSSNKFLEGHPMRADAPALRALYDTLYEFNYYKKLRRPPAVLLGGLDAWTDLFGHHYLQTSKTAVLMGNTQLRRSAVVAGRPIGRVPMASVNSSIEVRRRRLREHNPLDADEERAWLEKARKEEVQMGDFQQSQSDGEVDSGSIHSEEPESPLVHSYEDFLRRFPSVSVQQSMITPAQPISNRPTAVMPEIPSRPMPAVSRPSYSGVSERASSLMSPTTRQTQSSQPPLYTTRATNHYPRLPRTGLINFSVTCYMNATIQCLLATIPLSLFFLNNEWRDHTQKNWKGSNGIMPEIYANLIRSLWQNDVQAIRPSSLRNFCARLNREWGVDRQQDAKEFFDFLIDCLHEDLNINWKRNPLLPLTAEEEVTRERMPMQKVSGIEWTRYTHREDSFVSKIFAGQHASRLRCTTCQGTSTTYEAFYSISVEIPRSGRGDIRDCLRSYCQEEMLSGDEVWKCPNCKCEREATKRITITRMPQVLVVHFKRFSASKTESARKVHTPIEFPLHGLSMEPYMVPLSPASAKATSDGMVDPAITPPFLYDAYAVLRHLGQSGNGGHYISLVRDTARGYWRKFDDDRATDFDPSKLRPDQRLQNEQAYIVFYRRAAAR